MKTIEVQLKEALATIEGQNNEIATLKGVIHQNTLTAARVQRDRLLKEAKLSIKSIEQLHEAFAQSTDNAGLKQAINVVRRYCGYDNC
jgi:hypothetical protein